MAKDLKIKITNRSSSEEMVFQDDDVSYQICPVQESDKEGLIKLFNMLSPESRHLRFAHAITKLPESFLKDVVDVDQPNEAALVAVLTTEKNARQIIGIARYAPTDRKGCCEFSLTVADAFNSHGIGTNLMQHLIRNAKTHGVRQLVGYILPTNNRMIKLVTDLSFKRESSDNYDYQKFVLAL